MEASKAGNGNREDSKTTGRLIALEGNRDVIETQLRLLPPSQKFLVLPSILDESIIYSDNEPFHARSFVQKVNAAYSSRLEKARSFLRTSEEGQPRLVFANGGSVSARASCIARIAESLDGDVAKAELTFDDLVKNGVAGLMDQDISSEKDGDIHNTLEDGENVEDEEDDSPTARAMKAAEALERETSDISSDELVDHSAEALHGDRVVPDTGIVEDEPAGEVPQDSTSRREKTSKRNAVITEKKELLFTAAKGEEIRRTVIVVPQRHSSLWHRRNTVHTEKPEIRRYGSHRSSRPISRQLSGWGSDDDADLSSACDETFPTTPGVEYGEACLVDMQSSESELLVRKSKSVDRFFPSLFQDPQQSMFPQTLKHSVSHSQLRTRLSKSASDQLEYFPMLPRTTFVKASQTTIRKSPTESEASSSSASSFRTIARVFVDRGTDAGDPMASEKVGHNTEFEPVFPVVEDLIIHLNSQDSDDLLRRVINSYKDGSYSQFPSSHSHSQSLEDRKDIEEENSPKQFRTDKRKTYDPSAYTESRTQWPLKQSRVDSAIQMDPPTPFLPSPTVPEKFVEFSVRSSDTAVDTQNSLRHILSVHVPPSEGFTQQTFQTMPDLERLHKPVFRIDDSGSTGESGRTVDQILALGCEAGVKNEFFSQISGYIEKLGTKKSGLSRSGRIDIR